MNTGKPQESLDDVPEWAQRMGLRRLTEEEALALTLAFNTAPTASAPRSLTPEWDEREAGIRDGQLRFLSWWSDNVFRREQSEKDLPG